MSVYFELARSLNQRTHTFQPPPPTTTTTKNGNDCKAIQYIFARVSANICTLFYNCNFTSANLQAHFLYKFYKHNLTSRYNFTRSILQDQFYKIQFHKYNFTSFARTTTEPMPALVYISDPCNSLLFRSPVWTWSSSSSGSYCIIYLAFFSCLLFCVI
jgi:hypothetical protein